MARRDSTPADPLGQVQNSTPAGNHLSPNAWQPIATAPKEFVQYLEFHSYGQSVLLFPYWGEVVRGRWWQGSDPNYCNWLADGGAAFRPTHWMPLPAPPVDTKGGR